MPFQTLFCVWKGMPTTVPFHISMPFDALPNPHMIWQSKEGHALLCFAISYWGLEGHGRASGGQWAKTRKKVPLQERAVDSGELALLQRELSLAIYLIHLKVKTKLLSRCLLIPAK